MVGMSSGRAAALLLEAKDKPPSLHVPVATLSELRATLESERLRPPSGACISFVPC